MPAVPRLDVNMVAALGLAAGEDPIEVDPQLEIYWSRDGGYTWGNPVFRSIGKEGESKRMVNVSRLGLATGKGYRFRFRMSDPRPAIMFGAEIRDVQQRKAA
jgi:hypothetical protein